MERWCPDRHMVLVLRIIPYPNAGGANCTELLEYTSHSIWQKTCKEMMLVEAIFCPPPLVASLCCVCSNSITVNGALSVFEGSTKF
jgi:hypothetical protein